uniref:SET domain-containing protein n=1 Tax=Trypanosoma congolense (strain IL3000) TaxID=1068625 RepID=G0UUU8_TRYCI|nr:conserved hypothetical protein [Trypanosoma congolense IL3000]
MEVPSSLRCAPARRSLKFPAGDHACNFLVFDTMISKHDRMILYMEIMVHAKALVNPIVLPHFTVPHLPEQYTELRVITDLRHPAYGQIGLFARKTIPANVVITPYSGYVEIFPTSCNSRTYTMGYGSLSDDYALDAEFVGNYGRFANDPRGVGALTANISAESRFTPRGETYTALVSRRVIAKGEEILMAYGKDHNLRHNPWTGIKGETLTQYRLSAPPPFRFVGKKKSDDNSDDVGRTGSPTALPGVSVGSEATDSRLSLKREREEDNLSNVVTGDVGVELFWECPQCGAWSTRCVASPQVDFCDFCSSPRVHRTRLVAVRRKLSPLQVTQGTTATVTTCTGAPNKWPSGGGGISGKSDASCINRGGSGFLHLSVGDVEAHKGPKGYHDRSKPMNGSAVDDVSTSVAPFSSCPVGWPLNIPFLPWQIWDAAVPLSTIGKHSRFETHSDIFLYTVGSQTDYQSGYCAADRIRRAVVCDSGSSLSDDDTCEEEEEEEYTQASPRRGHRPKGRQPRVRRRKEELWIKEDCQEAGDVHLRGRHSLYHRSNPPNGHNSSDSPKARDYLFVLSGPLPCKDEGGNVECPYRTLQYILRDVTRRVFAGKPYRCGDVVASVGGLIRLVKDRRQRPDGSVLQIPMRYFMPKKVREELRSRCSMSSTEDISEHLSLADLLKQLDSFALIVTNEMMFCPCLTLFDKNDLSSEDNTGTSPQNTEVGATSWMHAVLDLCNLSFVLTIDALGCPYVAAIAIKDIATFDSLLARIG